MDVIQNSLVLVCGEPGKCKTTVGNFIAPNASFAADLYGQYDSQGNYLKERAAAAHAGCLHDTKGAMVRGEKVIAVHNTFIQERSRIDYLIAARIYGYVCIVIKADGGVYPDGSPTKNIHNVPDEVVERMSSSWEPHQPPIPAEELEVHVLAYGLNHKDQFQTAQVWEWVRLMARNEWQSVPSDIRKDSKFWRLVNSFRYWDESGKYLVKEEIVKSYDLSGMGIAEFAQVFDAYWAENPDFYKLPIKEISVGFGEFARLWLEVA